jgi:hypothetical protein
VRSPAQPLPKADTVEISDGQFAGHPVGSLVIMRSPCVHAQTYHYQINYDGELRVHAKITCGSLVNAGGGEALCKLGPKLTCDGRTGTSAPAGTHYVVEESGVGVQGKGSYSWADRQEASALMAKIRAPEAKKCDAVLARQARDQPSAQTSQSAARTQAQQDCRPTLEQLGGSRHGGRAVLGNGRDVTVLCP